MNNASTYGQLKRKQDKPSGNLGFTLVEMIVVLVILTILASLLIPGLLGWIDEAKGKQYVLSARSVYMAAQAIESEKYAAWDGTAAHADHDLSEQDITRILKMADTENATIEEIIFESETLSNDAATSNHGFFTIKGISVRFEDITVNLADGVWSVFSK